MATRETTVKLTVADNFSAQLRAFATALDQSEKQVSKTSSAMKSLSDFGKGFTKFAIEGAVTSLGAAIAYSIHQSAELESTFGKIAGLTDTPKAAIAGLRDQVIGLSKELPVSANELAKGLYFISSSGYQGAQAMDILNASAKASAAGLGQTETIADAVTSSLNAYKLGADQATRMTDILTQAVKEGKGEPAELAASLGRVLPIAAAADVSMEQVAASMATMTRTGIKADEAATALRGTIGALLAPSKQAKDALGEIGLTTEMLADKLKHEGLVSVLQLLMERTHGNVEALDAIIPNIRALTGVLSTAGSQGEDYVKILGSMENAAGATDKAFAAMSDTLEFKLKKAQNSLEAVGTSITNNLLPVLGTAADAFLVLANGAEDIDKAFVGTRQQIEQSNVSYDEYRKNLVLTAEAAGKLPKAYGDIIMAGGKVVNNYIENRDITADLYKNIGLLTEAERDLVQQQAAVEQGAKNQSDSMGVMEAAINGAAKATKDSADANWTAIESQKELTKAHKQTGEWYGDLTNKAISYTASTKKLTDLQDQLAKLDEKIASQGSGQVAVIQNKKMSEDQYAAAIAKRGKIEEDLQSGARKKNETDAEYSSRMADLKVNLDKVNESLGTHTGVVGGATKAQLDNRDAILKQIQALQEQDNTARAMEGFKALEDSLKEGKITIDQYNERTLALNTTTHLYSFEALAAAQKQKEFLQVLSDPTKTWAEVQQAVHDYSNALKTDLTPASQTAEKEVAKVPDKIKEAMDKFANMKTEQFEVPVTVKVKTVVTQDEAHMDAVRTRDKDMEKRENDAIKRMGESTQKGIGILGEFAVKTTDKAKAAADTTETRFNTLASNILSKMRGTTGSVIDAFSAMGLQASGQLADIEKMIDKLPTFKEFIYKITVQGEIPSNIPGSGAQHGANFIVPPNPRGGSGDYFPVVAAPGERVIVQTAAQQQQQAEKRQAQKAGDTFIYNTNVYNPLAAAMLADKQRRDRLARSNARMGVAT